MIEPSVARSSVRARVWTAVYGTAIAALLALNVWWLARDLSPLPPLKTIAAWSNQQRFDEAETALHAHLRRAPHNVEATILLAGVRAGRDDKLGAARLLHAVPAWWFNKREMRALEGQLFLDSGRARDAEAAWRACLDGGPADASAKPSKADAESALGLLALLILERRLEEARRLARPLYGRLEPVSRFALLRARLTAEWNLRPSAADAPTLRRYSAADRDDGQARRALALAELAEGHGTDALRTIEECRRSQPNDLLVRRDLLTILRTQGSTDRFSTEATNLPPAADQDSDLCRLRGLAHETRRDWTNAAIAYRRALELDPAALESATHLADAEQRAGQIELAARDAARARALAAAFERLRSALDDAIRADAGTSNHLTDADAALGRLAAACDALSWTEEASACESLRSEP